MWSNLINPPLIYLKNSKEARRKSKWNPPPKGWAKLNFNGAARGNLRIARAGIIINDDKGQWIARKAISINPTSNNLEEGRTLEEGLKLCLQLGLSKIYIERDSQIVLNAIRNRKTPNWVLNSKLEEIIYFIDRFEDVRIFHIFSQDLSYL